MLKMFRQKLSYLLVLISVYMSGIANAIADPQSLGQITSGLMEPVGVLTKTVYNICYVLGGTLILGALIQYKSHRDNPSHVRISQPIFLLVIGLVVIAIPFVSSLSAGSAAARGY